MTDNVRERLGRLFEVGEPRKAGLGEPQPGELMRGTGWLVSRQGASLQLHYVSGEVGGRDKVVQITPGEAQMLEDDPGVLNDILLAHGVG